MQVREAIQTRASYRSFEKITTSDEIINNIVSCGSWSPSGCNSQEIRFLIIRQEGLNDLSDFRNGLKWIKKASFGLVLFADKTATTYVGKEILWGRKNMIYIDGGMAAENMILGAMEYNLQSCCVNVWKSDSFKVVIMGKHNVPDHYTPITAIVFGKANGKRHSTHCGREVHRQKLNHYIIGE